jgi:hypothetical protein
MNDCLRRETWGYRGGEDDDVLGCNAMWTQPSDFSSENGESMFLRNVGIHTASQLRRITSLSIVTDVQGIAICNIIHYFKCF